MNKTLPIWRSLLYVPTTSMRFVDKASTSGADAVILDLEDSIPESAKADARSSLDDAVSLLASKQNEVLVRVNRPWQMLVPDLESVVQENVRGIVLPKVDDAGVVRVVDEMLTELEIQHALQPGHTRLFVRIESARGLRFIDPILSASGRTVATAIGSGDLSFSTGWSLAGLGLPLAHLTAVTAAIAANCLPLGLAGTITEFKDLGAFRDLAVVSRDLGSVGSPCIHPSQVPILNEVFQPTKAEVDWATRVLHAFDQESARKVGSFMLDGEFIDVAMYEQARRIQTRTESMNEHTG